MSARSIHVGVIVAAARYCASARGPPNGSEKWLFCRARSDRRSCAGALAVAHGAVRLTRCGGSPCGLAARHIGRAGSRSRSGCAASRSARIGRGADHAAACAHDPDRARNRKTDRSVRSAARVRQADRRPAHPAQRAAGDTDHSAGIVWGGCRPACPFFTTLELWIGACARLRGVDSRPGSRQSVARSPHLLRRAHAEHGQSRGQHGDDPLHQGQPRQGQLSIIFYNEA